MGERGGAHGLTIRGGGGDHTCVSRSGSWSLAAAQPTCIALGLQRGMLYIPAGRGDVDVELEI